MDKAWRFMQTYPMPELELDILREIGELIQGFDDDPRVLAEAVVDVDAIIAGSEPITREVIEAGNKLKVIVHCFTGSKEFAKKLIDIGCYISISGIITFKKNEELIDAISHIPLNRLLVETDSPYLAPAPNRGKSNEPSFIVHTVEKLSILKRVEKKILIENTTNNFKKLFNIK